VRTEWHGFRAANANLTVVPAKQETPCHGRGKGKSFTEGWRGRTIIIISHHQEERLLIVIPHSAAHHSGRTVCKSHAARIWRHRVSYGDSSYACGQGCTAYRDDMARWHVTLHMYPPVPSTTHSIKDERRELPPLLHQCLDLHLENIIAVIIPTYTTE
jgi:hypothetical protein